MSNPLQPLIDALRSAWPQADGTSLATAADQLLRGHSATLGTSIASLTFGQGNDFREATISIGTVAGRDVHTTNLTINFPQPINPQAAVLQQLLYHHESATIFANRLESFVGRETEIAEIRQRIAQVMPTGGYITITAQAGEGKSSVIAKMVSQDGPDQTAFHFIALTPGREYQLSILRTLTARLIVKHQLSATYFPEQSYPAMRDFLPYILRQLSKQGIQEVIYVDGLDQLELDFNEQRDLSFLPTNPPPGIVFVLGTRPDDTLKPLEVMKPQHEYRLPHLSYADFQQLLGQREIVSAAAERLYQALRGNALYLALVVGELTAEPVVDLDRFIQRISDNPDNLFGLTIDRLCRRDRMLWRDVLAPTLALLLVAQEPLDRATIRGLFKAEDTDLRAGLGQLGGLVAQEANGRYFLYHRKIRDYLQEDLVQPNKPFVVSQDQIVYWHARLAAWCVGDDADIERIWLDTNGPEQTRRWYARHHYVTHLALGRQWDVLCRVMDEGIYGYYKRRLDPSTHLYARDLERARDVATQLDDLSHIWQWSLLRVTLTSQVDWWPESLFLALIYLDRTHEALSRVELLSDQAKKIRIFCSLAPLLDQDEARLIWKRAQGVIESMDNVQEQDTKIRSKSLHILAKAQARAGLWNDAYATAEGISDTRTYASTQCALAIIKADSHQAQAATILADAYIMAINIDKDQTKEEILCEIAKAQAEAELWGDVYTTVNSIGDACSRAEALCALGVAQARTQHPDTTATFIAARINAINVRHARQRVRILCELAIAQAKANHPDVTSTFALAIVAIKDIEYVGPQAEALCDVTLAQAQVSHPNVRTTFALACDHVRGIRKISPETESDERALAEMSASALFRLAMVQTQLGLWHDARTTANDIRDLKTRAETLREISMAQAHAGLWDDAQITAEDIGSVGPCAEALGVIALTQAQAYHSNAAATFVAAHIKALGIHDARPYAEILRNIAIVYAQIGLWDEALMMAIRIEDNKIRAEALCRIGLTQAQAHHPSTMETFTLSQKIAKSIKDDVVRRRALSQLVGAYAYVGWWDDAWLLAKGFTNDYYEQGFRSKAFHEIVKAQIKAKLWDKARNTIVSIPKFLYREEALIDLVAAQIEVGLWDDARTTIDLITSSKDYIKGLGMLAVAQSKIQHPGVATAFAAAEAVINGMSQNEQAEALCIMIDSMIHAGLWDDARAIAEEAGHNSWIYSQALNSLAVAQAQMGLWDDAHATVDRILQASRRNHETLHQIAVAEAGAGLWDKARTTINHINNEWHHSLALRDVAIMQTQAELWNEACTTATDIHNAELRSEALSILASTQIRFGLWQVAQMTINMINDATQRIMILENLYIGMIQAGDLTIVRQRVGAAWSMARTLDELLAMAKIAMPLIQLDLGLGTAMAESFALVNTQLRAD